MVLFQICKIKKAQSPRSRQRACKPRFRGVLKDAFAENPIKDGHTWLKYGQKKISNKTLEGDFQHMEMGTNIRRHYFQCKESTCPARRVLDQNLDKPSLVNAIYKGEHTCCRTVDVTAVLDSKPQESDSESTASSSSRDEPAPALSSHDQLTIKKEIMEIMTESTEPDGQR